MEVAMATETQVNIWADTVVSKMREAKDAGGKVTPLTFAYAAIKGSGITHWPDVKRLGRNVLTCINERRSVNKKKPSQEDINQAILYQ